MFHDTRTQNYVRFSFSAKIVTYFVCEVAVKLQQNIHCITWYIRAMGGGILRADLLLAVQTGVKLLASQQGLRVCALEYNKGFVIWL